MSPFSCLNLHDCALPYCSPRMAKRLFQSVSGVVPLCNNRTYHVNRSGSITYWKFLALFVCFVNTFARWDITRPSSRKTCVYKPTALEPDCQKDNMKKASLGAVFHGDFQKLPRGNKKLALTWEVLSIMSRLSNFVTRVLSVCWISVFLAQPHLGQSLPGGFHSLTSQNAASEAEGLPAV